MPPRLLTRAGRAAAALVLAIGAGFPHSGCIDNELSSDGPSKDRSTKPADSAQWSDSGDSGTGHTGITDSNETAVECPDSTPPDGATEADETCTQTPVVDWDLRVKWQDVNGGVFDDPHLVRWSRATTAMDIWAFDFYWDEVLQYSADGSFVTPRITDVREAVASSGDVGWGDGSEVVAVWLDRRADGSYRTQLGVFGETDTLETWEVGEGNGYSLWLFDSGADGDVDALLGGEVVDLATGTLEATLEGTTVEWYFGSVSADLDGDGADEVVAVHGNPARTSLFANDGSFVATCREDTGFPIGYTPIAVGNLDADDDGEFVTAGSDYVAVCDADGTLLQEAEVGAETVATVALADLDGSGSPEVLLGSANEVIALDADLVVRWRFSRECGGQSWRVFSVSDLDADGRHEVLINACETLWVVDGDGNLLGSVGVGVGSADSVAHRSHPMVADIDGDGLAEIIVPSEALSVVDNPTGGWAVAEMDVPWHGVGRRPGDRGLDGTIPAPTQFWLEPGSNVWQGTPAGPAAGHDLAVRVQGVCVESCTGDAVVTLAVGNEGAATLVRGVDVRLTARADGAELGVVTVPGPLDPGVVRYVTTRVAAAALTSGLTAAVAVTGDCGTSNDTAAWTEGVCQ